MHSVTINLLLLLVIFVLITVHALTSSFTIQGDNLGLFIFCVQKKNRSFYALNREEKEFLTTESGSTAYAYEIITSFDPKY